MKLSRIVLCLALSGAVLANDGDLTPEQIEKKYNQQTLIKQRYGLTYQHVNSFSEVAALRKELLETVKGQDEAIEAIISKLVSYLDNFDTRTGAPVYINMIGFPAVGKNAITDFLEERFLTLKVDAQSHVKYFDSEFFYQMLAENDFLTFEGVSVDTPRILIVDELDKLSEYIMQNGEKVEVTNEFIGMFNQLINSGSIQNSMGGIQSNLLSNVLVISTMNFSSTFLNGVIKEVIGKDAVYESLNADEMAKVVIELKKDPKNVYKALSALYKPHTVSRIASDTIIMNSLSDIIVNKILSDWVNLIVEDFEEKFPGYKVTINEQLVNYVVDKVLVPTDGVRGVKKHVQNLVEQLLVIAKRYNLDPIVAKGQELAHDGTATLDRDIDIKFDSKKQIATLEIKALNDGKKVKSKKIDIKYLEGLGAFENVDGLTTNVDHDIYEFEYIPDTTAEEMIEIRRPKVSELAKGLGDAVAKHVFGQTDYLDQLEKDFNRYLSLSDKVLREPISHILAGFPGVGKSEAIKRVAEYLGIKVIDINLQYYTGDTDDTVKSFFKAVNSKISKLDSKKDKKYILAFEELDKVPERNEYGQKVPRPVITAVKDILDKGFAEYHGGDGMIKIDARGAFVVGTMNLDESLTRFSKDPRITTLEDVMDFYNALSKGTNMVDLVLAPLFRPETVSRFVNSLYVLRPLDLESHVKIINQQPDLIEKERFHSEGRNLGLINIELTPKYLEYIQNESIIPAENGRNTAKDSRKKITRHMESVVQLIPEDLLTTPLTIVLDFDHEKVEYIGSIKVEGEKKVQKLVNKKETLKFPPALAHGPMEYERISTAMHELGHAFAAVRLGRRIESISAVESAGAFGMVIFKGNGPLYGNELAAQIYIALASRAMERIFFSKDTGSAISFLSNSLGISGDTDQATTYLYKLLYELGLNPNGGSINRQGGGANEGQKFVNLPSITAEQVSGLEQTLRAMEDFMIKDFLEAHDIDFFEQQVRFIATEGIVKEKKFYEQIGYEYPGNDKEHLSRNEKFSGVFNDIIKDKRSDETKKAMEFKQGNTSTTAQQNFDAYMEKFVEILEENFPEIKKENKCQDLLTK